MASVLITGSSGYIGVELARFLTAFGWYVYGLDKEYPTPENEEIFHGFDHCNLNDLLAPEFNVDIIIHLAGASKIDDSQIYDYTGQNVDGTKRLRDIYPNTPIVHASTCAIYDENGQEKPAHAYSQTKLEAEQFCDINLRLGTVCGTNQDGVFHGPMDCMIHTAYLKDKCYVSQGDRWRAIIGLSDVCKAFHQIISSTEEGTSDIYSITTTLLDMAFAVSDVFTMVTGMRSHVVEDEGLSGLDKEFRKTSPYTSHSPPGEQHRDRGVEISMTALALCRYRTYRVYQRKHDKK